MKGPKFRLLETLAGQLQSRLVKIIQPNFVALGDRRLLVSVNLCGRSELFRIFVCVVEDHFVNATSKLLDQHKGDTCGQEEEEVQEQGQGTKQI